MADEETTDTDPEVEELIRKLNKKAQNNVAIERNLATKYKQGPDPNVMLLIRLDTLAGALLGKNSRERLEYELEVQDRMGDVLMKIEQELVSRPSQQLIVPQVRPPADLKVK